MKYKILGNTDLEVSEICLGTMTFGEQNTEEEAHEQLQYATSNGVNFIDTAEMYSVPGRKETQGDTERFIGTWLQKRAKRDDLILATKATGPNPGLSYIRNSPNFSKAHLNEAIEGSLNRLQTDYVDLYQLHWPERKTNFFGKLGYVHDSSDEWINNIGEVLGTLETFIKEGKVRHIGISNETSWGMMQYLNEAQFNALPKITTIQNPYSLLNRSFEVGLSEMSMRENVSLLAYSPLAFGVLSGKYLNNEKPEDARLTKFTQFSRYNSEQCAKATSLYAEIAKKNEMTLAQLSLAFINQQPFVGSTIIGATNLEQLKENMSSTNVTLTTEIIKELNSVNELYTYPAP
jgi:aryl-alcohol dehydrogenase-like predicted oxidoreductase